MRSFGCDAVLLDHDAAEVRKAEFRCALQPLLPVSSDASDVLSYARKTRLFLDAIAHLPRSSRFDLHVPVLTESFDLIVVGSDEVWNLHHPWYGGFTAFFGHGLASRKLISYAASFGNQDATDGLAVEWAARLERFDRISVRDENSRCMIRNALGFEPSLVLDPCLQFPPQIAPAENDEEPYVLVYGHSFPDWFARRIRGAARERGLRLLSIGYRNDWADEQRIAAGPEEFARLMAGAAAVATNFFHGCVFAFLNGRPLVCVPSAYRSNKIHDLTAALGAEQHLVDEDSSELQYSALLELQPEIAAKLADLRRDSSAFLTHVLECA
ncbi:polysaccharide pyruvyl transferase family protein [Flaviflagellibacter deserti]|uniref:Polysaccharide pyruvyl transferase family protein n=1 Tax=Flaviflagellibacter deserti TaxID=2267266 RepID=A0ABV9Z1L7_9HYPH